MKRLAEYDLTPWTKDELIDLLEEYPTLFEMSEAELNKLARDRYNTAQGYVDRANRLENEADAIVKYSLEKYRKPKVNN